VSCAKLIEYNRASLKGLQASSILRKGTRIFTSHVRYDYDEYCHWTFPDDDPAQGVPSYMMARRLKPQNERTPFRALKNTSAKDASVIERSLALLMPSRPAVTPSASRAAIFERIAKAKAAAEKAAEDGAVEEPPPKLFNRVVRIDGETAAYEYWYVLTYLPDLQWCHVAPLEKRGAFGGSSLSAGRPRWMLVPEDAGGEIDVSAARCVIMEALERKKTTENADEEEWDIVGEASEKQKRHG